MSKLAGWAGRALLLILAVTILTAVVVYVLSERQLRRSYDAEPAQIAIPTDSAAIARGEHLARAVTTCTLCHGLDGGGSVYADMGPMGRIVGPNLTSGRARPLGDSDWILALRHGLRADRTSLIVMPSEVFTNMSADDVAALIAYYRQLPAVERKLPDSRFGPLGRALLAAGKLNILVAGKTPDRPPPPALPAGPTPEYGRYLASIAGCHGCHGHGLSGGQVAGPPGLPPASNLTPAALGSWSQKDFIRVMRTGKRANGTTIDEFMPWRGYANMTDSELTALWVYLQSVPARAFGNK